MSKTTRIDTLKRLAKAATQGSWHQCCGGAFGAGCQGRYIWLDDASERLVQTGRGGDSPEFTEQDNKDLQFIAAANPKVVLALCAEIGTLRRTIGKLIAGRASKPKAKSVNAAARSGARHVGR